MAGSGKEEEEMEERRRIGRKGEEGEEEGRIGRNRGEETEGKKQRGETEGKM